MVRSGAAVVTTVAAMYGRPFIPIFRFCDSVWTVRNDRYKLVKSDFAACDAALNPTSFTIYTELTNPVGLDNSPDNLLAGGPLNADQQSNKDKLMPC